MKSVGERIKSRRLELDWTQDELAQRAGISKSFLSEVENGKRSTSSDTLFDLARALDLSLDYLMKGEGPERDEEAPPLDVQVPRALSTFADEAGISYRQTLALLALHRQIVAYRTAGRKRDFEKHDWEKLYKSVKEFL